MTSGIYVIENTVNKKKYVGLSTNIEKRWCTHKATLRGNYHENDYLQKSWNKYGESSFIFYVIETISSRSMVKLKRLEILYIDKYKTYIRFGKGYNLNKGGDGNLGWIPTEEQLINNSKSKLGIPCLPETKIKLSKALTGKPKPYGYGRRKQGVKKNHTTSSKYIGVSYDSERKKWRYEINKDGRRIRGRRDTEVESAIAYNELAIKMYGNKARLNII